MAVKRDHKSALKKPQYVFKLFVTGATPNSLRAVANLKQICEQYCTGNYTLDIVDVYQDAEIAKKEQLIALPMLIMLQPLPERHMIGDLSETKKVLEILGLKYTL